jgi:hypothetical protein
MAMGAQWNSQVSSFRTPMEWALAILKKWRIPFADYRRH